MQNYRITSDSISLKNSDVFIERITTFPKTYISNCSDSEKIETTFLNLPIELANILIPVLITILLFFIGYFINWLIKKYERKRELESIKTTVTNWIDLIDKPIQTQISSCEDFAKNLRSSVDLQPESIDLIQLHASKLKELDLKQLIETFITNLKGVESKKSKDLFNIVSQIEYFSSVELMIPEAYKIYQNHTFELMTSWNDNLKELDNFKNSMVQQIGTRMTHTSYPFLLQINNITNAWSRNNPNGANLNITKTQLLDPLYQLSDSIILANSNDSFAPILQSRVQDLILIYKRKVSHFNGNAKIFDSYVSNMNLSYKTLKSSSCNLPQK